MIHVSVDQGEVWDMAQLPDVGHEQFYSILSSNDDMVFVHVDEPGGQLCVCVFGSPASKIEHCQLMHYSIHLTML